MNQDFKKATSSAQMQDEFSPIPSSQGTILKYKGKFTLQSGAYLIDPYLTYNSYGKLNDHKNNTIIVCQPLTANTQLHTWWGKILGEKQPLNTSEYFIICIGMICSPYGQICPMSINPQTNKQYLKSFPETTIRDSVRLQIQLIKSELKINQFLSIIGGSLGGFQALQWQLMAKDYEIQIQSLFLIASSASYSAWQMSFSRIMLQAIYNDPKWENYDVNDPPNKGLALAREIGMISYRSKYAYDTKFGRETRDDGVFQLDSYLKYQGQKFVKRFDPLSYVAIVKQMNTHDLGRGRGGIKQALGMIDIPVTIASVQGDVLCGLNDQLQLIQGLPNVLEHVFIKSNDGHDGYLLAWEEVGAAMRKHLQRCGGKCL